MVRRRGSADAIWCFVVCREAAVSPYEMPAVMRGAFKLWFGMIIRILDREFL
jgi:hypothetical protein